MKQLSWNQPSVKMLPPLQAGSMQAGLLLGVGLNGADGLEECTVQETVNGMVQMLLLMLMNVDIIVFDVHAPPRSRSARPSHPARIGPPLDQAFCA